MGASFSLTKLWTRARYGVLEVMLRDIVVQPLTCLRESCRAQRRNEMRVRFLSLGEVVADHIEKLVFPPAPAKIAGARGNSPRVNFRRENFH